MISGRFLTRMQWERKLLRWGCCRLEGKGRLNTAEWWRGANGGYPFTVPVNDDGTCDYWAIWKLCEQFGIHPSELNTEH